MSLGSFQTAHRLEAYTLIGREDLALLAQPPKAPGTWEKGIVRVFLSFWACFVGAYGGLKMVLLGFHKSYLGFFLGFTKMTPS